MPGRPCRLDPARRRAKRPGRAASIGVLLIMACSVNCSGARVYSRPANPVGLISPEQLQPASTAIGLGAGVGVAKAPGETASHEGKDAMTETTADPRPSRRAALSAFLLGVAMSRFFDGVLLHQVLQWHYPLSLPPGRAFRDPRVQSWPTGCFTCAWAGRGSPSPALAQLRDRCPALAGHRADGRPGRRRRHVRDLMIVTLPKHAARWRLFADGALVVGGTMVGGDLSAVSGVQGRL
jgi:hypothetical protein